ncbi:uncharacterized protein LOC110842506 [Folsomia candida]|uniref:Uncharacterized protein n=1 Tax=Folsomia candida TaxID=158441 RepID=A0A226F356_FOLCA|nr:uncharacterized protein LOC110842506 [Folsomia candida]OXA63854.1 hypothetical protein Fcan01_01300 [Folsomia candida]
MLVTINIKTGLYEGRKGDYSIEELRLLHDNDITVDRELTWVQAIAQVYDGFKIDSKKYYVRRIRSIDAEALHGLHEPISDLLTSEFKQIKKRCCVLIMEFDELITFADMAKQKRSSQIESHVEDPPTPQDGGQLRPRRTIKRKNMREEDDFEFEKSARSPRRKKSRKKQRYTREVQNGWGDDMNEEILFVEKEEFASGSQDFYNRAENHRRPRPPRSQPFPSQYRQPSHQQQQRERGENKAATCHKEEFLHRARTVLTNSQLLKARHALQQLKQSSYEQGDNKWTKWVLESPGPVNIIRLLFDV